ncbi:MAG: hypothetical protein ABIV05_04345 [Actinomycetota bacterium]
MDEFTQQISARVAAARQALQQALADGDDYLVAVREGELDSLTRLADSNDVTLIDLTELEQRKPA